MKERLSILIELYTLSGSLLTKNKWLRSKAVLVEAFSKHLVIFKLIVPMD